MVADWNLEGSLDGENWAVLHEGRENDYISTSEFQSTERQAELNTVLDGAGVLGLEDRIAFVSSLYERHLRRTWDVRASVGPNAFYRFFRIRKVGNGCLHGSGLELFGDVFES
jgi:hypothetical protein